VVNENIANLLLAAKFGALVCSHVSGVGLCEIVQHLSMFDYVALSGTTQCRRLEWINHLHEHFAAPAVVTGGPLSRAAGAGGVQPRSCRSRWPSTATVRPCVARQDALTADAGPLIFGPLIFGGSPSAGSTRGQCGGGGRNAGCRLGAGIRAFDTASHYGAEQRVLSLAGL
jgi:hypothetical protein